MNEMLCLDKKYGRRRNRVLAGGQNILDIVLRNCWIIVRVNEGSIDYLLPFSVMKTLELLRVAKLDPS